MLRASQGCRSTVESLEKPMDMAEIGLFSDPEGHIIGVVKNET